MSTPYFTTGAAMADRLTEIAEQLRPIGDIHKTYLDISFQITNHHGDDIADPARMATIDAISSALGLVAADTTWNEGTPVRQAGAHGISVYGVRPKPVEVQREELQAQLAALDAQIAATAAAVLTPDSPDLPAEPEAADDLCAPYLRTDDGLWSIGAGTCPVPRTIHTTPAEAVAAHNSLLVAAGIEPAAPVAVSPERLVISDSTIAEAERLERLHTHDGRDCYCETPDAVSPERVAEISDEQLVAVADYINQYRNVWLGHHAERARLAVSTPGSFFVVCSCEQELGPFANVSLANTSHQEHAAVGTR